MLEYEVKQGDSVFSVAYKHGISVNILKSSNNWGSGDTVLWPGDLIIVPVRIIA